MTKVWFGSDFHLGQKNISKFRPNWNSEKEHREFLIDSWRKIIKPKDTVYILGDFCFTEEAWLKDCLNLPGAYKYLVRGNHDYLNHQWYGNVFDDVYGIVKYKEFWLSHCPIHPEELRGKINLHGHVHNNTINDHRYLNCCVENLMLLYNRPFISLDEVRLLRPYVKPTTP